MKKILVFLFAFLLLVECIRVTGLFRRLLQRHSPWGQGEDRRPLPRYQGKSRLLLPRSLRLRERRRRLWEDLHAKVTVDPSAFVYSGHDTTTCITVILTAAQDDG